MEEMLLSEYIAMLQKLKEQHGDVMVISDSGCNLSPFYSELYNAIVVNWNMNKPQKTSSV